MHLNRYFVSGTESGAGYCKSASGSSMGDINNSQLLFNSAHINGEWVLSRSGRVFDVLNPATLQVITSVPDMDVDDLEAAISAAHTAFQTWSQTTVKVSTKLWNTFTVVATLCRKVTIEFNFKTRVYRKFLFLISKSKKPLFYIIMYI